jgi:hypothetical protein
MGFGDFLQPFADLAASAIGQLREAMLKGLLLNVPGLPPDCLRKGELPVATSVLEAELRKRAAGLEGIESLALTTEPGRFKLILRTRTRCLHYETTLFLGLEAFEFTSRARAARLRCLGVPQVKGVHWFDALLGFLAAPAMRRTLRSVATRDRVSQASGGLAELQWPHLSLDLGRIQGLAALADAQVLGKGLLDLLAVGPVLIEPDRVVIKIRFA